MYPLDAVYGPKCYHAFDPKKGFPKRQILTSTLQTPDEVWGDAPIEATSYAELVDIVSFLAVMNKRHALYFRGQGKDWKPHPAAFRPLWTSLTGTQHSIPNDTKALRQIWAHLNGEISEIIMEVCQGLPMPRRATLEMFREAVWAVAQHYELWPTPLVDVTPSLRVAASFALWGGRESGYLYVFALIPSTNSVTFDADQHIVLARLQAVCPPVAKRPHYQDGFLAGRFPFVGLDSNQVDRNPKNVSNLARRLVARIRLTDHDDETSRTERRPTGQGFWSDDFPRMSVPSLLPDPENDRVLKKFHEHSDSIDRAMHKICKSEAYPAQA